MQRREEKSMKKENVVPSVYKTVTLRSIKQTIESLERGKSEELHAMERVVLSQIR